MKLAKLAVFLALPLLLAGCSPWERTTFQTLSAAKVVIDQSQGDYEARTIPHTQCVYDIINKAKAADTVAVNAMVTYETIKAEKGDLAAQENVVIGDLATLGIYVAEVKTITATTVCGSSK